MSSRSHGHRYMSGNEVRDAFVRFFESKAHLEVPSSSLVPINDPTVLLTTAGMQQMTPYFLGLETPPAPRLCSVQKCFRTVDIDEVGDESHCTFFFMLGNFSVGDYFKKESLAWSWEFLTGVMGLPAERLYPTVHPDDTDAFAHYASEADLVGVPDDVKAAARAAAQADGREGYKLSLQLPSYLPVMQFAKSSALRQLLYRAYVTRASDQAEGDARRFDNSDIMRELLALRQEEAALLGYANFGEVSLVPKMADSPAQVIAFLRELAGKARPFAERDVRDLREFARDTLALNDPQAWDWPYVGEQLKEARYAFSEQEVKPYFPLPKVLAGLFKIVETLFEVSIRPDHASVWHSSVEFYRIERAGQLLGQFYLDPLARTGKRGGAWMDDARARWLRPDTGALQTPVAYLVCNFASGVDGKPPLLTHDDATTLFHEFGHGLHHMLTQVAEHDVSGISGVEWDAVELPSQFMENFCWEWSVLRHMTAHVDTGEPLPRALFDKMLAARNYQAGLQTLRQVEFSLFDMRLHTEPATAQDVQALLDAVRAEVAVLPAPAFNRMAHTFSHIFAGGYAAGYYSYKWAEVLSADAYAAFEESAAADGTPSVATGRRYRQAILEVGGSRPAMESFKAFRGREPSIDALLRHQGMA